MHQSFWSHSTTSVHWHLGIVWFNLQQAVWVFQGATAWNTCVLLCTHLKHYDIFMTSVLILTIPCRYKGHTTVLLTDQVRLCALTLLHVICINKLMFMLEVTRYVYVLTSLYYTLDRLFYASVHATATPQVFPALGLPAV